MEYENLVWITGASRGLGLALAETVPWDRTLVVGFGRTKPAHFRPRLPEVALSWVWVNLSALDGVSVVDHAIAVRLEAFQGKRLILINNAGSLDPICGAHRAREADYRSALVLGMAPLAIGQRFLQLVGPLEARRVLINVSSGAAQNPYAGWSAYCAVKAALDMWTRTVALEQARLERPVAVHSIAPGILDTAMQVQIRSSSADDFPSVETFKALHAEGALIPAMEAAKKIWRLIDIQNPPPVADLRDYPAL